MLRVRTWDEISGEWGKWDLERLSPDCRDAEAINQAIDAACCDDPDYKGWTVNKCGEIGPVFVIETRSNRNHLAILLVISEEQEPAPRTISDVNRDQSREMEDSLGPIKSPKAEGYILDEDGRFYIFGPKGVKLAGPFFTQREAFHNLSSMGFPK